MISHKRFAKLRFVDFLIGQMQVETREDWEFHDRKWIGEGIGFSDFLRLESDPNVLRCMSLDLSAEPQRVWNKILADIELPLEHGLSENQVCDLLGKPFKKGTINARTILIFAIGAREQYEVECVFRASKGLIYLTVTVVDRSDS